MIEFSTQLFDNATIARLAAHYRLLLGAVVADPDVRLADIGFLTRPERDLLVAQRIPSPPRVDATTDAVSASVRSTPEAIAVVADDGRLDFRHLDARAGAVAHRLRELGVRSGDLVALLADGTSWLPAAMLGVHRLGAAYLPLDPLQPRERLEFMLADAAPRAIIVGAIDVLPTAGPPVVRLDDLDELVGVAGDRGAPDVPSGSGAANPAYVLYTSGSSGVPKGVVIPRSALENHMAWMLSEFEFGPHDRVLQRTTPIFDASVWEFWAPMMAGAQLVLLGTAAKRDPAEIAAAVRHHRITVLQVVPGLLQALLDEPDFLAADALRIVFSGGEALPDALRDHFGAMFDVPLVNLYGPTEATIDATFHRCRPGSGRSVSIGRPIAGTGAVVLDRSGRPTPIGVPGRLHLSGQGLALGYLGQPRLTAERFVPDEFGVVPGARLYDTGDLARFRTDGDLEYLGRNDLQVKVRGFRIELAEVERAVEACSGVRRAAAAVHDDQIVAYVAPEPAAGSASDDVDEAEQEVLDRWEDIYEQIYGPLSETPTSDEADRLDRDDPDDLDDLDAIGWVSSFTGRCIDRGAMAAWRDQTVERILALQPHRVLEIGCGTGMILSRIAPETDRYVGIDLSAPALRYVDEHVVRGSMPSVELLQRPAHALDDLCGEDFDVVVLNSVVQYFPSARYLEQVLDDALRCVRPGGALFVGDVRSLPLLPAFHAAVEAARSDGSEPVDELRRRIDDAVSKEEELVLSPEYFIDVAERHGPARCEVLVKRNGHVTEMSAFRFDAVIRLGPRPGEPPTVIGLDWRRHQLDADRLAASVVDAAADVVIVSGIPDRMVNAPVETFTAGHVPARGVGDAPDDVALSDIARQAGRELTLRPSIGDVPGRLDALFCRPGVEPPGLRAEDGDPSAPRSNEPERGSLAATLIPRIRSELEQRLPEYMTPARFVVMPELPTLPSGKIDRTALPTPSLHRSARVTPFVEPSDRLEELLVEVWRAVTGVDAVGTHDDFFGELGGHSLLAARLAARLRSVLDTDVPLQLVFDAPTIVAMASALRGSSRLAVDIDGEAEIATGGSDAPATGGDREREVEHVRG